MGSAEYRVIHVLDYKEMTNGRDGLSEIDLNSLGVQGWELTAISPTDKEGRPETPLYIFSRPMNVLYSRRLHYMVQSPGNKGLSPQELTAFSESDWDLATVGLVANATYGTRYNSWVFSQMSEER